MRPYAGPLLVTGNLLRHFNVLEHAHGPTYYFEPLPLYSPYPTTNYIQL